MSNPFPEIAKMKSILLALLLLPALSGAVTLKIATVAPDGTGWMKEMRAAGDRIKAQTDGRVKIKFYPGGVMGDYATVMRKMRIGQLHGGAFTSGELATRYPDLFLYNTPFLFADDEEVEYVRQRLEPILNAGLEEKGIVVLGSASGGFVYLFSDKPVRTFDDLSRAKVWTPEGDPVSDKAFRLAGVTPIPLTLADVYTALQTGMLDTVVNTTFGAIAFQWHTKMRYMVDFPIAYVFGAFGLDKRTFYKLSEEDQAVLRQEFAVAFKAIEETNRQDAVGARAALINQGIEVLELSEEQRAQFNSLGSEVLDYMGSTDDFTLTHLGDLIRIIEEYRGSPIQ